MFYFYIFFLHVLICIFVIVAFLCVHVCVCMCMCVCVCIYIYIYIYILICTYLYFCILLFVFSVICMHQIDNKADFDFENCLKEDVVNSVNPFCLPENKSILLYFQEMLLSMIELFLS